MKMRKAGERRDGPPRGTQTRQRLLEAGIEAFTQFGPKEVGIRRLAAAAGVNSAALSYYFGGKEGYYQAVLRYLMDVVGRAIQEAAREAKKSLPSVPTASHARQVICQLMRKLVVVILTNPYAEAAAVIIWRELLRPSSGFPIVYEQMIRPVHEIITELSAAVIGVRPQDAEAVLLAHSLWGQAAIFRMGYHVLRRRLGWRGRRIPDPWVERIADTVEAMAARMLGPETPPPGSRERA